MTICPFCGRDPFHYVDVGVGSVPVAVDCCELGDLYFRGQRPEIEGEVLIPADEFRELGNRIGGMQFELEAYREKYGPIWTDDDEPTTEPQRASV